MVGSLTLTQQRACTPEKLYGDEPFLKCRRERKRMSQIIPIVCEEVPALCRQCSL
jgi:hypothetical protein